MRKEALVDGNIYRKGELTQQMEITHQQGVWINNRQNTIPTTPAININTIIYQWTNALADRSIVSKGALA